VLGLTILRADGTSAKCGSKAVKNVAGYDVARLMVGARGELGFIVEAILRLYPLRALPRPAVVGRAEWGNRPSGKRSIVRTNAEAWEPLLAEHAKAIQATDPMTRTAWLCDIPTLPADAVAWTSDPPYISVSQAHRQLMHRAKAIFDPESSLQRQ
jgi:glycolate oxidase FAD binding subunit